MRAGLQASRRRRVARPCLTRSAPRPGPCARNADERLCAPRGRRASETPGPDYRCSFARTPPGAPAGGTPTGGLGGQRGPRRGARAATRSREGRARAPPAAGFALGAPRSGLAAFSFRCWPRPLPHLFFLLWQEAAIFLTYEVCLDTFTLFLYQHLLLKYGLGDRQAKLGRGWGRHSSSEMHWERVCQRRPLMLRHGGKR